MPINLQRLIGAMGVAVILLWTTVAQAQAQAWVHVQSQLQQLDEQLDSFASQKLATSAEVLIARSKIRVRVIARDLLNGGVIASNEEVAMVAILYGSTITDHLNEFDELFALLPNVQAMADPSPLQRKRYLFMRPGLATFSNKPMRRLKLEATTPLKIRNLVALEFAPLLDVLAAADLPATTSTWPQAKPTPTSEEIMQLARHTSHPAARKWLNQLANAMSIASYQPQAIALYHPLQTYLKLHQILMADRAMFIRATPLFEERFEVAIAAYPNTAALRELIAFGPLVGKLAQLNEQLLDTVALQNLLAVAVQTKEMPLKWQLLDWMTEVASFRLAARQEKRFKIDITKLNQAAQRLQNHPREVFLPQATRLLKTTHQAVADQQRQWRLPRHLQRLEKEHVGIKPAIEKILQQSQQADGQHAQQLMLDFDEQANIVAALLDQKHSPEIHAQLLARRQQWADAWINGHIANTAGYWTGVTALLQRQVQVPRHSRNALALLQVKTDMTEATEQAIKHAGQNLQGSQMAKIRSQAPHALAVLDLLRDCQPTLETLPLGISGVLSQLAWAPEPAEHDASLASQYAHLSVLLNELNHPTVRADAKRRRVLLTQAKALGTRILNRLELKHNSPSVINDL